jgi:hypothetical protein
MSLVPFPVQPSHLLPSAALRAAGSGQVGRIADGSRSVDRVAQVTQKKGVIEPCPIEQREQDRSCKSQVAPNAPAFQERLFPSASGHGAKRWQT